MSTQAPHETADKDSIPGADRSSTVMRWHRRVLGLCLVIFALELGLFLLIFPWRREWEMNWVPVHSRQLAHVWMSRYFRGIVSGLGLLNIYVAGAELAKQLKPKSNPNEPYA